MPLDQSRRGQHGNGGPATKANAAKVAAAKAPEATKPNIQRLFDAVNECNNSIRRCSGMWNEMDKARALEAEAHAKLKADLAVLGIADLFDYSRE